MADSSPRRALEEQLRSIDSQAWMVVAEEILPRVRGELQKRYGVDRRWVSAEEAVLSACRTLFRRLQSDQATSYSLESFDDFEALLFTIARHKLVDALRVTTREERHAAKLAPVRPDGEGHSEQVTLTLLRLMEDLLEDDRDRTIFREKMNGKSEEAIAEILRAESGVPWSKYMVREAWRRFRTRARRKANRLMRSE